MSLENMRLGSNLGSLGVPMNIEGTEMAAPAAKPTVAQGEALPPQMARVQKATSLPAASPSSYQRKPFRINPV
jgi:hypothetical protein